MESVNEVEENYIDQLKRKSSDNKTLEDESDFCEKSNKHTLTIFLMQTAIL